MIIGQGKPLILLPALGVSGNEGLNIAESLAGSYECHLLDLPGIGKSELNNLNKQFENVMGEWKK